jgi:ApaG protein
MAQGLTAGAARANAAALRFALNSSAQLRYRTIVGGRCPGYPAGMKELFQHSAMTNGITVRVAVNFLPEQSRIDAGNWFWVYHIRIENGTDQTVQLLTRHWRITDGRGLVNLVEGEGVVGEQPILAPGQSHDYVSGCPLTTPMGSMEGHYVFRSAEGGQFEVAIPFFPLAAPATAG